MAARNHTSGATRLKKPTAAARSEPKSKFRVAVTGDHGLDVFTRYMPGCLSGDDENALRDEDRFFPTIAYDLSVPSGGGLVLEALLALSDSAKIDIVSALPRVRTMPVTLHFVDLFKWGDSKASVLRITNANPLKVPEQRKANARSNPAPLQLPPTASDLLVIHDATPKWHDSDEAAEQVRSHLGERLPDNALPKASNPKVIVNFGESLPSFHLSSSSNLSIAGRKSQVWQQLWKHRDSVTIVCSATALRHAGAAISRRVSWEQTIEDVVADIQRFEMLRCLSLFRHLIIRFGFVGALHLQRDLSDGLKSQFIFAPKAQAGIFRDEAKDGRIVGRNQAFIACLAKCIGERAAKKRVLDDADIAAALQTGLLVSMRLFDSGFPCPSTKVYRSMESGTDKEVERLGKMFLTDFFSGKGIGNHENSEPREILNDGYLNIVKSGKGSTDRILGRVEVPLAKMLKTQSNGDTSVEWQILRSQVRDQGVSRINIGIAICTFGHDHVLNRKLDHDDSEETMCGIKARDVRDLLQQPECRLSENDRDDMPLEENTLPALPYPTAFLQPSPQAAEIYVPILEFGKLVAIERDEIESLRSIRNLMRLYQEGNTLSDRPMSIAVFGAPGSGKSFAVKQIADDINVAIRPGSRPLEIMECNVAQFRTVDDLEHVITRIASLNNQRRIPLVFFDEFDCAFGGKALGWLKYFLAPMQDGTFYAASQTISFGRAIFVFAGGMFKTIAEFNPYVASRPAEKDVSKNLRRKAIFQQQKGPDFISRLRGHIDIRSINPDGTASKDENGKPVKPVIRRAMILRGQIVAANLIANHVGCQVASVDDDVLYALLTVDEYRHGARSMEAILQMCTPIDKLIEKASLPSRAQLNMHVDAEEFFIRLQRGRYRKSLSSKEPTIARTHSTEEAVGILGSKGEIDGGAARSALLHESESRDSIRKRPGRIGSRKAGSAQKKAATATQNSLADVASKASKARVPGKAKSESAPKES